MGVSTAHFASLCDVNRAVDGNGFNDYASTVFVPIALLVIGGILWVLGAGVWVLLAGVIVLVAEEYLRHQRDAARDRALRASGRDQRD